jgi:DNA-3-methyladenine glycosylase
MSSDALHRATRAELSGLAVDVAPLLLGAELRTVVRGLDGAAPEVHLRLTEVEAYHGHGTGAQPDPGSHARMGRTARNATMWGEPGHLYVYLSHGIHSCVNVVCGPEGQAGGILMRAGEIVGGLDAAAVRRGVTPPLRPTALRDLARGPGRFGQASGLRHPIHDGIDAVTGAEFAGARAELWLRDDPVRDVATGPRVGVAGIAGTEAFPWRCWIAGDPTVSPFRWGRGAQAASAERT